ncbi:MAG: hypothetical protein HW406_532 [Candidatus Brocadiaceae bacterium]|nr:hypothetical protein [Candidatus Brocadiaceae bacterium]
MEQQWVNMVSYCNPENKVSIGLVEGISINVTI